MNFQGVVMNVADLDRSIAFYRDALGFSLASGGDQLAAMRAPDNYHPQVIVLRAFGTSPLGGARHIGLRAFLLEVKTDDHVNKVAAGFEARACLVGRRDHEEWTAVVGHDPDGVTLVVTCISGPGRTDENSWRSLDDFLYSIGE